MLDHHEYFATEWVDTIPETEEYGISSIVFQGKRPFHPYRLAYLLQGHIHINNNTNNNTAANCDISTKVLNEKELLQLQYYHSIYIQRNVIHMIVHCILYIHTHLYNWICMINVYYESQIHSFLKTCPPFS